MFGGDRHPQPAAGRHRLGGFLIQALDAILVVGMDDGAGPGSIDQRDILADAVKALHLEAIPIGPHRRADAFRLEQIGNLVAFDRMVEGRDLVAEFLRHADHVGHLVGAVAVVLHQYLAGQHPGQRVEIELAARCVGGLGGAGFGAAGIIIPLALVDGCIRPELAGIGDIAHARGGQLIAAAINALGILAAGHLQTVGRPRKLHLLHAAAIDRLERHTAAAEQIGRTGQHVQRGDAAGQRARKARVLRPHAMFGPHFRAGRAGGLVAVAVRLHAGAGIDAQMAVDVDDAGRHIFAGRLDQARTLGHGHRGADLGHLAVLQPDHGIFIFAPGPVIDGGAADHRGLAGVWPVLAGPRVLADPHHFRGRGRRRVLWLVLRQRRDGHRHRRRSQQPHRLHHQSPLLAHMVGRGGGMRKLR